MNQQSIELSQYPSKYNILTPLTCPEYYDDGSARVAAVRGGGGGGAMPSDCFRRYYYSGLALIGLLVVFRLLNKD